MIDDFESQEVRSSGDLWSEICSSLPEVQPPENNTDFKDSFQPETQVGPLVNGQSNGSTTGSPSAKWEPMEDSQVYLASLGIALLRFVPSLTVDLTFLFSSPCLPSHRSCHSSYSSVWKTVE